jgi:teichuronic acid biosynthesis glycosyltransferase TuaH
VAVSPTLEQRWRAMGATVLMVPNGVQVDAYDHLATVTPAPDVALPGPVAVVMGYLSPRIDINLLEAVVDQGCSLLLIGPYDGTWEPARFAALCRRERVAWVGQKRYEELPAYLRHVDVGLTPYQPDAFNRAAFPLKTLEYLSAGLPAVSTDLPATRWLDTELVWIASDPSDFAKAAYTAATSGSDADRAARRAFAAAHSWEARAARIASAIGLA